VTDWDLITPSSLPWDQRRDYMRQGSFEGTPEQERKERKLIREHYRPTRKDTP
jgi:hypothetical protein